MDYIYQEHVVDLLEHVLGLLLRYRPSRPVSFVQEWLMLSGRPEPTEEHFGQRCCIYSHPSGIILCSQCNWTHDGCDDRKQYVQQKAVRGLLDAVIGALLQNQPEEPAFFLQEWLSTFSPRSQSHKSKTEAAVMSMMNQGYEEDESCTNSDINLEDQTPGEMEDQDKRNKHIWAWLGQISLPSLSTNSESASQDTRTISEVGSIVLSVAESSNTPPASPCGPTFFTTTSTRSNRSDRSSFSSSSQVSRSTRSKRSCLARREFVGRSTETRNVKFNV